MSRYEIKKKRLEKAYAQAISESIIYKMKDPRLQGSMCTVTRVEINNDLTTAHVFITLPDRSMANKVIKALYLAENFFLVQLKERIKIKYLPKMKFYYDNKGAEADRVAALIDDLSSQYKQQSAPGDDGADGEAEDGV